MAGRGKTFIPHEAGSTAEAVAGPSNRSFGLVVGGIMAAIGGLRFALGGHDGPFTLAMLGIGATLIVLGLVAPGVLTAPNRLWMKLGLLLGLIMTPVVMGLVYVTTFLPIGLLMKLRGHDPLRRARANEDASYWIVRDPPGPDPKTMPNQF